MVLNSGKAWMKTRGVPFPWSVYPTVIPFTTVFTIHSFFVYGRGIFYFGQMEAKSNILVSFAGAWPVVIAY
jgi:hypothetical protein